MRAWTRWAAAVGAGALVALVLTHRAEFAHATLALVEWSRASGPLGVVLYAVGYLAATVLVLPGSVLTLGAGFAWGPVWGVLLVSPVSVAAATASFLLGRTLARSTVERRLGKDPRLRAIDRAIAENGFKLVLLLRLSPVLPFNVLNYALALTRVSLRDYVLGSAVGMFPATVLYVYLGSLVPDASSLLRGGASTGSPAAMLLTGAGVVATVGCVVLITRVARRALQRALIEVEA